MPRARRRPYCPNKPTAHDRRAMDLLRNAQVAPLEVVDPYDSTARIIVMRSTRNDPLAFLDDRGHIDDAQYQAGRAFQNDWEIAERGARAIDPSKEAVDGGLAPESITEAQRKAIRKIAQVHRALGPDGSPLTQAVLIDGQTYEEICKARGLRGRRWEEYFGLRFRECLHRLSYLYGFATEPTGKKRMFVTEN